MQVLEMKKGAANKRLKRKSPASELELDQTSKGEKTQTSKPKTVTAQSSKPKKPMKPDKPKPAAAQQLLSRASD